MLFGFQHTGNQLGKPDAIAHKGYFNGTNPIALKTYQKISFYFEKKIYYNRSRRLFVST